MSIHEVTSAIGELQLTDPLIQSPGWCRRSAIVMHEVAKSSDITQPHAEITIVAFPRAQVSEDTHYALRASGEGEDMIFNPVATSRFPCYLGPTAEAPGLLSKMVPVEEVL
ncbi:hypothetical protein BH09PAT1_BH09PAT1_1240 [soil metagenome]